MYQSPEMLNEWQKMDRRRETDDFKAVAYRDATQWRVIQSENRSQVILMSEITGAMRAGQFDAGDWEIKVRTGIFIFPGFIAIVVYVHTH